MYVEAILNEEDIQWIIAEYFHIGSIDIHPGINLAENKIQVKIKTTKEYKEFKKEQETDIFVRANKALQDFKKGKANV